MAPSERMTCADAFARLDAYLDRTLTPEEAQEVEGHLQACSECACEYRYEERFLREVRAKLKRLQAPPELMRKIRSKLGSMDG
jgi:anti-sigma factor (TIGR02949 family)